MLRVIRRFFKSTENNNNVNDNVKNIRKVVPDDELSNFPNINMYGGETMNDNKCPICFESWKYGIIYFTTCCNHQFHPECLEKWVIRTPNCPICRSEF